MARLQAQTKPDRAARSWAADNGNGTYSNPLFYDEFSDPDLIRVGEDYYLTGTTMHAMPGLPILHSRDLVNWRFVTYAFDRLDLGPDFRLADNKEIYGQGIWAPCFRYHNGVFYIFANVNRFGLQVFRATNIRGPWTRNRIDPGLHDLSVLFDDDGKIYAVYGVRTIRIVELNDSLTALVPGTDRVLIEPSLGMGEGSHLYKIRGRYYIVSAIPGGHVPMKCARADRLAGPWEVQTISENESMGIGRSYRLKDARRRTPPFELSPPDLSEGASLTLHQGGIVDTPSGDEWWGFSMQDHNAVGRLTSLSPVTWKDGWPYFGLPGNLTRTPRTWIKPRGVAGGAAGAVTSPYERNDEFSGPQLANAWQWNHHPDDGKWSLSERPGYLRLHALPAKDFWWARNTLTQRAVGPESMATAELDAASIADGGVAGLGLLNLPYAWIGVRREGEQRFVAFYDQTTGAAMREPLGAGETRVRLRVHCDFDRDIAQFSYAVAGQREFRTMGGEIRLPFQLKTFQGVRYALFHFQESGAGIADFDRFAVAEPRPRGLTKPIPYGRWIAFEQPQAVFRVIDRGQGRVALRTAAGAFLSVNAAGEVTAAKVAKPGEAETFQWVDLQRGDLALLSRVTHRYLATGASGFTANHRGPSPDRRDGSCFRWRIAASQ